MIALDAATGAEKWQAKVTNEVIAAPAIGMGMVFVRSNDGRVTAFDAASGERRWFWTRDVPTLSVRGNDAPVLGPGLRVRRQRRRHRQRAVGRPTAVRCGTRPVAQAEGRTELDRMADVDGTPVLDGTMLYATSFKKPDRRHRRAERPPDVGQRARRRRAASAWAAIAWSCPIAAGAVFGARQGRRQRAVAAAGPGASQPDRRRGPGRLRRGRRLRRLPALAASSTTASSPRARASVASALRAAPVVADGVLVVQNIEGELSAFRLGQ